VRGRPYRSLGKELLEGGPRAAGTLPCSRMARAKNSSTGGSGRDKGFLKRLGLKLEAFLVSDIYRVPHRP